MTMEIRTPTPQEEAAFFGHNSPHIRDLFAGFVDGKCVAMCGVMRDPRFAGSIFEENGRWIAFLQLAPDAQPLGAKAVLAIRRYLKAQTEPIVAQCEDFQPKAERLLAILGFKPTDRFEADFRQRTRKLRIWTWQK